MVEAGGVVLVNPYQLAAREASRQLRVDVRRMERLAQLARPEAIASASDASPVVRVDLQFRRDEQGDCHVTGEVDVDLVLRCGNCKQWVEHSLRARLDVRLIRTEARATQRARSLDVIHCPEDEVEIETLVEDDLLLVVPDVPCGLAPDCAHRAAAERLKLADAAADSPSDPAGPPAGASPFAALASLKKTPVGAARTDRPAESSGTEDDD